MVDLSQVSKMNFTIEPNSALRKAQYYEENKLWNLLELAELGTHAAWADTRNHSASVLLSKP